MLQHLDRIGRTVLTSLIPVRAWVSQGAARARSWISRLRAEPGKRTLVNEILSLQVLLTAAIGILAVAGLFWTTQWVLRNNVSKWAAQWTVELNELGAPLYLPDEADIVLRVERFIHKYPEIERVTYYELDGSVLFSVSNEGEEHSYSTPLAPLTSTALIQRAATDSAYVLDDSDPLQRVFRIRGPIWTESIASDGLLDYDPDAPPESTIEPIGFVGLDLDFSWYYHQLVSYVWVASLALLILLLFSGIAGRFMLKRALASLSGLQEPIEELAKGNLEVRFEPAHHREIAAIVETLETTTAALRERDAKLSRLANHDALTGLYNRHRFVEELTQETADLAGSDRESALYFIDLDQFKYVNDTCGHPTGDRLLALAAQQLRRSVRYSDIVARFGGDEFAILARNVSCQEAKAIAISILDDMRRLAHIEDGNVFHLQCSIGITMIKSESYGVHELVAQADIACHEAKSRGRNRLEFYKASANETEQMALDVGWMHRIRQAIATNGFVLHYQPIVNIHNGQAIHYEALLRMKGENDQLIAPDAFLPAAARFGLMADIDRWVIEHALKELARFKRDRPELNLAINLSGHAFDDEDLTDRVRELLEAYELPAQHVIFEITEQVAIHHLVDMDDKIAELRDLGCKLAIDDFGAGYSSFSYLKRLPVDYIKIDGSFIKDISRDPVDQTMVRLIGEIGKATGMKTIAECVEDSTALDLLQEFGIEYAQGFYLGRPTPAPAKPTRPIALYGGYREAASFAHKAGR